MARSSSEDRSVLAIDRRRHVPHEKKDLLNDLSARSDGSALTTLLCPASGIFVMCLSRYNEMRAHLSTEKDAPVPRAAERAGHIECRPVLGGLHHQDVRMLRVAGQYGARLN